MARMVRKQVYIQAGQEDFLKRRAKEMGVSESELIRRGIEQVGRGGVPLRRDPRAWDEAKRLIQQRMAIVVPQTGRSWTREELYEERLERFSRR